MSTGLRLTLDGVDVGCHAWAPLSVAWGRDHPGSSFEPRRAVVSFDDTAGVRKGQELVAQLNAPASNPRWSDVVGHWSAQVGTWTGQRVLITVFRGTISDLSSAWAVVGVNGEPVTRWGATVDVTAIDPVADLANLPIGDVPWPQESISARAARIQALTPLVWQTDPSAALVAARDVDAQPALDLLDDLAHMGSLAGGIVYDPNTDRARFLLDAGRNSLAPTVTVSACSIGSDARLTSTATDVVNDVTVTYKDPAVPDAEPTARYVNAQSVADVGRRTRTISTELISAANAAARAQAEAVRYGIPLDHWTDVTIGTPYGEPSRAAAQALLAAGPATRVALVELPAPAAASWSGYLEGWSLEVDADDWSVTLNLSPAPWSGPLLKWQNVDAGQSWSEVARPWSWSDSLAEIPYAVTDRSLTHAS